MPFREENGVIVLDSDPEDEPVSRSAEAVLPALPALVSSSAAAQKGVPHRAPTSQLKTNIPGKYTCRPPSSKQPSPSPLSQEPNAFAVRCHPRQLSTISAVATGQKEGSGPTVSAAHGPSNGSRASNGPAVPFLSQWTAQHAAAKEQSGNGAGQAQFSFQNCRPSTVSAMRPGSAPPPKCEVSEEEPDVTIEIHDRQQDQVQHPTLKSKAPSVGLADDRRPPSARKASPTRNSGQVAREPSQGMAAMLASAAAALPGSAASVAAIAAAPKLPMRSELASNGNARLAGATIKSHTDALQQSKAAAKLPQRMASLNQLMCDPNMSTSAPNPSKSPALRQATPVAAAAASAQLPGRLDPDQLLSIAGAKQAAAVHAGNGPTSVSQAHRRVAGSPAGDRPSSIAASAVPVYGQGVGTSSHGMRSASPKPDAAAATLNKEHTAQRPLCASLSGQQQLQPAASPAECRPPVSAPAAATVQPIIHNSNIVAALASGRSSLPNGEAVLARSKAAGMAASSGGQASSMPGSPSEPLSQPRIAPKPLSQPCTPSKPLSQLGPTSDPMSSEVGMTPPSNAVPGLQAHWASSSPTGPGRPSPSSTTPVRQAKLLKTKTSPKGRLGSPSFGSRARLSLKQESRQDSGEPSVGHHNVVDKLCAQLCPQGSDSSTSEAVAVFPEPLKVPKGPSEGPVSGTKVTAALPPNSSSPAGPWAQGMSKTSFRQDPLAGPAGKGLTQPSVLSEALPLPESPQSQDPATPCTEAGPCVQQQHMQSRFAQPATSQQPSGTLPSGSETTVTDPGCSHQQQQEASNGLSGAQPMRGRAPSRQPEPSSAAAQQTSTQPGPAGTQLSRPQLQLNSAAATQQPSTQPAPAAPKRQAGASKVAANTGATEPLLLNAVEAEGGAQAGRSPSHLQQPHCQASSARSLPILDVGQMVPGFRTNLPEDQHARASQPVSLICPAASPSDEVDITRPDRAQPASPHAPSPGQDGTLAPVTLAARLSTGSAARPGRASPTLDGTAGATRPASFEGLDMLAPDTGNAACVPAFNAAQHSRGAMGSATSPLPREVVAAKVLDSSSAAHAALPLQRDATAAGALGPFSGTSAGAVPEASTEVNEPGTSLACRRGHLDLLTAGALL